MQTPVFAVCLLFLYYIALSPVCEQADAYASCGTNSMIPSVEEAKYNNCDFLCSYQIHPLIDISSPVTKTRGESANSPPFCRYKAPWFLNSCLHTELPLANLTLVGYLCSFPALILFAESSCLCLLNPYRLFQWKTTQSIDFSRRAAVLLSMMFLAFQYAQMIDPHHLLSKVP